MTKMICRTKRLRIAVAGFVAATTPALSALADEPEVEEKRNGIYTMSVDFARNGYFHYYVDTKTHLCLVRIGGAANFSPVPCEDVARRPGWEEIITWVEMPSAND